MLPYPCVAVHPLPCMHTCRALQRAPLRGTSWPSLLRARCRVSEGVSKAAPLVDDAHDLSARFVRKASTPARIRSCRISCATSVASIETRWISLPPSPCSASAVACAATHRCGFGHAETRVPLIRRFRKGRWVREAPCGQCWTEPLGRVPSKKPPQARKRTASEKKIHGVSRSKRASPPGRGRTQASRPLPHARSPPRAA